MTAVEDFAQVVEERNDRMEWVTARNAIVDALNVVDRKYMELTIMANAGIISNAPEDLKDTLTWAYTQLQAFRQELIGNAEYMALHNWTPDQG